MDTQTFRRFVKACVALAAAMLLPAFAQNSFPSNPLRIIVPFAPGGSNDSVARILAPKLSNVLGQPVIVENKAGAGGALGAAVVARAAPDGYTILLHSVSVTIQPSMVKDLGYDITRDFEYVSELASCPFILVINPTVPAKTMAEFLQFARQRGRDIFFGSPGPGSSPHLAGELFNSVAGTRMTHVPYKGSGPMMVGVMGGEIHAAFDTINTSKALADAGRIRVLAIASPTRSPLLPDVPTMAEAGVNGSEVTIWQAMFLPKGTPDAIVTRWNAAIRKALTDPSVIKRLGELGFDPIGSTPAQLKARVESELVRWANVIKSAGIKPD